MFYYRLLFIICYGYSVNAALADYFTGVGEFLGFAQKGDDLGDAVIDQRVPYEVSIADEKFIHEAVKLTGVALSELDSCHHRVVLKLQTSCHKMNDEQLAKMAVMLLNCQSSVEGRRIYPCTDSMSIKDCTIDMDADTWNSYHLMSNRARALCYSVRQLQFRGLTETTVNRLMDASREQLVSMNRLSKNQEHLHNMAEESLDIISQGQKNLLNQQQDLERVQFQGQLAIEDNIKRVIDEKKLIAESHKQLVRLTESVRHKIEEASKQLDAHQQESRSNHEELLDDLISIQNKAHVIFQRIEDSSKLLLQQSEEAQDQYKATLTQLSEVNATIHALVSLVNSTREALEERLAWLTAALGGTDVAVDRLYMIVWHGLFLLITMIASSFLRVDMFARIIVATSPPLNLLASLQQSPYALDFVGLSSTIGVLVLVQNIMSYIMTLWNTGRLPKPLKWNEVSGQQNNSQPPPSIRNIDHYTVTSSLETSSITPNVNSEEWDDFNGYSVPTSPLLRNESNNRSRSRTPLHINGGAKSTCSGRTRLGTPCKLSAMPGREFCHRHRAGSSVMGS